MPPKPRRRLIDGVRERRDRHRERNRIIRAAAVLAGFAILLAGLAMLVLPGPGLLVTAIGLAVLALEFAWAERLLEKAVDRLEEVGDTVKRASRVQQILLGVLGGIAVAAGITAVYAWDIPLVPG